MPKDEKGLNRGGIGGQEGELGEDSKNLNVKRSPSGQQDRPGQPQERPGQPQRPGQPGQQPQRGGGMPGSVNEQERGGLRREPNLEGAEKDTDHEVD
jgi:hypothetical protein